MGCSCFSSCLSEKTNFMANLFQQLQQSAKPAPPQVVLQPPVIHGGAPTSSRSGDTWKIALIVVFVAVAIVVGVIIYNKSTERTHNANLIRLDDEDDWNDLDEDPPHEFEEQHKDPNFTLLRDIV